MSIHFFSTPTNPHVTLQTLKIAIWQAMQCYIQTSRCLSSKSLPATSACHIIRFTPPIPAKNFLACFGITKTSTEKLYMFFFGWRGIVSQTFPLFYRHDIGVLNKSRLLHNLASIQLKHRQSAWCENMRLKVKGKRRHKARNRKLTCNAPYFD